MFESQINWIKAHAMWSIVAALFVIAIIVISVKYGKTSGFAQQPLSLVDSTKIRGAGIGNNSTIYTSMVSDNASLQPLVPNSSLAQIQDTMPSESTMYHHRQPSQMMGQTPMAPVQSFSLRRKHFGANAATDVMGQRLLGNPIGGGRRSRYHNALGVASVGGSNI